MLASQNDISFLFPHVNELRLVLTTVTWRGGQAAARGWAGCCRASPQGRSGAPRSCPAYCSHPRRSRTQSSESEMREYRRENLFKLSENRTQRLEVNRILTQINVKIITELRILRAAWESAPGDFMGNNIYPDLSWEPRPATKQGYNARKLSERYGSMLSDNISSNIESENLRLWGRAMNQSKYRGSFYPWDVLIRNH